MEHLALAIIPRTFSLVKQPLGKLSFTALENGRAAWKHDIGVQIRADVNSRVTRGLK